MILTNLLDAAHAAAESPVQSARAMTKLLIDAARVVVATEGVDLFGAHKARAVLVPILRNLAKIASECHCVAIATYIDAAADGIRETL